MKTCTRCGEAKALSEYRRTKDGAGGLSSYCRTCVCEYNRKYYRANKERIDRANAAWAVAHAAELKAYRAQRHREHPEFARNSCRNWTQRHREEARARCSRFYINNPEKRKAKVEKWRRNNPEQYLALTAAHRARKRGAEGRYNAMDVKRIYAQQGGTCHYCAKPLGGKYQVDHKTPLSRGGSNWPDNLCCACGPCNARKNAKTESEFRNVLSTRKTMRSV